MIKKQLLQLANKTQLQIDKKTGLIFGYKQGYNICLNVTSDSKVFIKTSVCRDSKFPQLSDFSAFVEQTPAIANCNVDGYTVSFMVKSATLVSKIIDNAAIAVDDIVNFLASNRYSNCCQSCGNTCDVNAYFLKGNSCIVCSSCFNSDAHTESLQTAEKTKNGNIVSGIVGAFLGSLIGVALIVIVGQLGYVSALSGIVMAVCALKGYELLGKNLNKLGIVLTCIIIIVMVFVGCQLDWAVSIMSYYELDFFTSYQMVAGGYIDMTYFIKNLVMLYMYAAVGAVPTIVMALRGQKTNSMAHKMDSNV